MSGRTSRRGFLRSAAAAGGWLVMQRASEAAPRVQTTQMQSGTTNRDTSELTRQRPRLGKNALITVVTQSTSRDVNPRAGGWIYIKEILQRAGLFFVERAPQDLPGLASESNPLVLLAGDLRLTAEQRQVLADCVKNGGALIGMGGTSGLDEVFGVHAASPVAEGWMKVTAHDHRVTAGLRSSLHVFGGCAVKTRSATSLADLESGSQAARGSAITENPFGKGRAMLLAPDLIFSIVHIQQGLPVLQDRQPASDGSALTDDGVLKAEDGLVLDWQRDRQLMQPDNGPVFLEPVSDELREIILRSILYVAQQQGVVVPLLWYWPRGLKAVGHLSHDTDGNDLQLATALLEVLNRCNLKSTWCMLYPGGYPADFYRALREQEYEIALHYDAMTGGVQTSWSKDNFLLQHRWLLKEAGLSHITSNKNHYTRWENRLDFWRWCEEAGINSDQSRGPSKKGTIGFPLGGSQPYFPLDDERDAPRLMNVLEVNLLTQDLVVVCPQEYGQQLLDSALRHHGVAHFLFHPAHIQKPRVADALSGLVDYGRTQGLEWWTSERIYGWEMLRRGVEAGVDAGDTLTLRAGQPLREATLLLLSFGPGPQSVSINGQRAQSARWNLHGFEFDAVTMDVAGQVAVRIA
jgi:hypothetical protein